MVIVNFYTEYTFVSIKEKGRAAKKNEFIKKPIFDHTYDVACKHEEILSKK